jgi:hypothetical protein
MVVHRVCVLNPEPTPGAVEPRLAETYRAAVEKHTKG